MSSAVENTVVESGAAVVVESKDVARPEPLLLERRGGGGRIAAVDALRGVAALAVVLYHYTHRYGEFAAAFPAEYPMVGAPAVRVPWGHFGVQLFFMISGFVILMTVMKVRNIREFALLRFARLYPAFWAACGLTFGVTHVWELPRRTASWGLGAVNLTMLPAMFGGWFVDAVYWTLQQEMMFYVVMAVMLALGLRRFAIWAVAGLVVVSLCGVNKVGWHPGPDTPLHEIVQLRWFSLFLLGMIVYDARASGLKVRHGALLLLCAADVGRQSVWGGTREWEAVWADVISFGLLVAATRAWKGGTRNPEHMPGRVTGLLGLLSRGVVYLGTISYCLYLLHQNIGYVMLRGLYGRGVTANVAIPIAICVSIGLASAVTFLVERPACDWARRFVKARKAARPAGV